MVYAIAFDKFKGKDHLIVWWYGRI
jgi:hypothetical protein